MRWSLLIAAAALGVARAQPSGDVPPDLLLLARIKVHMQEMLKRQPNYTCIERIERSRRRPPRNRYELVDNIRLEVALVEGKEMFSWPGSEKFGEQELEKLVPAGGAIGNGNFALFARSVFLSNAPTFAYKGEETMLGKRAVRFDYRVALVVSGFQLKVNLTEATVGYHGSFWADAETLDLLRLEVIAEDPPPQLGLRSTATTMDYARVRIGEGDYLLPAGSEMIMTHVSGTEDRNRVQFSDCRQYTGQSTLTFSEAPLSEIPAPAPAAPERETVVIPAGLSFDVSIDAPIDSGQTMVGDPVAATLRGDIKHRKQVLFSKGARLTGRILRLERQPDRCLIDIRFTSIESDTRRAAIAADLEEIRVVTSPDPALAVRQPPRQSGVTLKGSRVFLPRGYRFRLQTQTPPQ